VVPLPWATVPAMQSAGDAERQCCCERATGSSISEFCCFGGQNHGANHGEVTGVGRKGWPHTRSRLPATRAERWNAALRRHKPWGTWPAS
jgi:hypothetical protein